MFCLEKCTIDVVFHFVRLADFQAHSANHLPKPFEFMLEKDPACEALRGIQPKHSFGGSVDIGFSRVQDSRPQNT